MGNEPMNAPNMDVAQKGEVNEQHKNNVIELLMHRDPTMLLTTHKKTPQIITKPWAMSVYHDDNHELVQLFDEIVSA